MSSNFKRGAATWALYLLLGYFSFLLNSLGPLFPFLRLDLGLSYAQASLHSSAFASGLLITSVVASTLARRTDPSWLLWGGASGMALGTFVLTAAQSYIQSLLGALLMGTLGALILIQVSSVLSRMHGERGAQAITEANAAGSVCAFLAPLAIGGAVWAGLGWRISLIVAVGLLVPLTVAFWRCSFVPAPQGDLDTLLGKGLPSVYWRLWGVLLLCVAAEFGVGFWVSDFLYSVGGFAQATAAAALSLLLIAMLLGRLIGSRLSARLSPERLIRTSLVVAMVGFAGYWFVDVSIVRLLGLLTTGLGIANLYPATLALALASAPGREDTASARASLASGLAILLAPFALGAAADLSSLWLAQGLIPLFMISALSLLRQADVGEGKPPFATSN